MKQETGGKAALQTGSQRREMKASFFIYIGTLVQCQPLESEWGQMNCTHVLQISGLVGNLAVLSLQKSVSAFSALER